MRLRPELRALRGDDTPQRDAQSALIALVDGLRAARPLAGVEAELLRYAGGDPLEALPLLAAMFDPGEPAARGIVDPLMAALAGGLAAYPLGHIPLRHYGDGAVATLLIARSGGAVLSLQAIDPVGFAAQPVPVSASFSRVECRDHVLAGSGDAVLVEAPAAGAPSAPLVRDPITLTPGTVIVRDGAKQALQLTALGGCLVSLRLQRRAGGVTREYALATGALLHQAAGNPRDSRLELASALLGRMERSDAAPLLAAMAEETGSPALRWQALRECLGLDTAAGFQVLSQIAAAPADPLAAPAAALRAQLITAHPVLAGALPCPA